MSKNRHGDYLLKPINKKLSTRHGYFVVGLCGKTKLLHRLLAQVFIPNPKNLPCINHIDGNKKNNAINNLEWCSYAHNNQHAYDKNLKFGFWKGKKGDKHHSSKSVGKYSLSGEFINKYGSASEAARENDLSQSAISRCARGLRNKYADYKWKYINTINK